VKFNFFWQGQWILIYWGDLGEIHFRVAPPWFLFPNSIKLQFCRTSRKLGEIYTAATLKVYYRGEREERVCLSARAPTIYSLQPRRPPSFSPNVYNRGCALRNGGAFAAPTAIYAYLFWCGGAAAKRRANFCERVSSHQKMNLWWVSRASRL